MESWAKNCAFLFLLALAESPPFTLGETTDDILQFLALGEEKMVFDPKHKDVVLVFGNTGSGKTTFTQWIAGDDTKLISIEEDPGNFVIKDKDTIGNSTVLWKTNFPKLVVDKETETAFYDLSGFGYTGGIKNDIASTYFIKRIIDHVDKIKILLVTDYEAMRRGGNQRDFVKLLHHISKLIKNIDRYTDSVGLVVTKVPNLYMRGKPVSDEAIVEGISNSLDDIIKYLAERIDLDHDFHLKMTNLISNIISENNAVAGIDIRTNGNESKIIIFRCPDDTGPLSSILMFQAAKPRIRTIISKNLKFTSTSNDDFSFMVSADTKHKLLNIIEALKESLNENVKTVVIQLVKHYEDKIHEIEKNVQSIDIHELEKAESELIKVQSLDNEVKDGINTILTLASVIENAKHYKDIAIVLKNIVSKVSVTLPPQIMLNVSSEVNFLDFVDESSILKLQFNTNLFLLFIQDTAKKLNNSSVQANDSIHRLSISIEDNIKDRYRKAQNDMKAYILQSEKISSDLAEIKSTIYNINSTLMELQKNIESRRRPGKIAFVRCA